MKHSPKACGHDDDDDSDKCNGRSGQKDATMKGARPLGCLVAVRRSGRRRVLGSIAAA